MYNFRLSNPPFPRLLLIVCCSFILASFLPAPLDAEAPDTAGTHLAAVYHGSLSITAHAACTVPLADSAEFFGPGGAIALGAEYSLFGNPQPFVAVELDYAILPVKSTSSSVSLLSVLAGGGIYFWFTPRLGAKVIGMGGYYLGFSNNGGGSSGQIALQTGAQLEYLLNPGLNLALGAAYRYDLGTFQGLAITASASYFLRGTESRRAAIERPGLSTCLGGTAGTLPQQILEAE